jgi:antimicrobial peptide system SdpB family protein
VLTGFGNWYRNLYHRSTWDLGYSLGRTLIGLGSLLALLFTPTSSLFEPTLEWGAGRCIGFTDAFSIYCFGAPFELMRWVSVFVLVLVVIGWRPRLMALPHAWVAVSLQASLTVIEGGDQIASNIALLLVPAALCDGRRWHWQMLPALPAERPSLRHMFANVSRGLVRLQVAVIYLHSVIAKLREEEWLDGTVIYYWLNDPVFGATGVRKGIVDDLVANPAIVTLLTWGTLVIELMLAFALFATPIFRKAILPLGVALHVGIAAFLGLLPFSIVMVGALCFLLVDDLRIRLTVNGRLLGRRSESAAAGERTE